MTRVCYIEHTYLRISCSTVVVFNGEPISAPHWQIQKYFHYHLHSAGLPPALQVTDVYCMHPNKSYGVCWCHATAPAVLQQEASLLEIATAASLPCLGPLLAPCACLMKVVKGQ